MLPHPVTVAGFRTRSLRLGTDGRLGRWDGRIVRVAGPVTLAGGGVNLQPSRVVEFHPEGSVSRTIAPMFSQRAILAIAPFPQRVVWIDSLGDSTGVTPAIVFSMTNHGEAPLEIEFRTNDVLCATVTHVATSLPPWRYVWQGDYVNRRLTVALGSVVRWVVPIPPSGMPDPGTYEVEASLCSTSDYRAQTSFTVQ